MPPFSVSLLKADIAASGMLRKAAKKSCSTNGQAIKRGRGIKARPLRKNNFFEVSMAIKLKRGGDKA